MTCKHNWQEADTNGIEHCLNCGMERAEMRRIRYVVRDKATLGADFLVWGDDDPRGAQATLLGAMADGLDVELVLMPADDMDKWTAKLIGA